MTPLTRLHAQRTAIRECIEANAGAMARHPDDRIMAVTLAGLNARLWDYYGGVIQASREARQGFGELAAVFGGNGHGPAIDDLISSSAFHRARAGGERKAAA